MMTWVFLFLDLNDGNEEKRANKKFVAFDNYFSTILIVQSILVDVHSCHVRRDERKIGKVV